VRFAICNFFWECLQSKRGRAPPIL